MSIICPAVLATDSKKYSEQMHKISGFARRVQIDLMDGEFTPSKSISLSEVWWPSTIKADIHLMYKNPEDYLDELIKLRPNLVVVHAEANADHMHFAAHLHKEGILAGLAVLPETSIDSVEHVIHSFDHLMIFSGDLGRFGGKADLALLDKVKQAKEHHEELEIGWDGGVNDQNAKQLAEAGVDVLNVGGFIQNSADPQAAYDKLIEVISK
jgi:ribulose-phosphate 3-epimerase